MLKVVFINAVIMVAYIATVARMVEYFHGTFASRVFKYFSAAGAALLAILVMQFSLELTDGNFLDLRAVPVIATGLTLGPGFGALVGTVVGFYRLSQAGSAALAAAFILPVYGLVAGLLRGFALSGMELSELSWPRYWRVWVPVSLTAVAGYLLIILTIRPPEEAWRLIRDLLPLSLFWQPLATIMFLILLGDTRRLLDYHYELHRTANTDLMTGLYNYRYLKGWLEENLGRRHRFPVAVVFIDADGFKEVNDEFGHQAGDEVIRTLGQGLQDILRPEDIIGRYGGDEFMAILPGCQETEALKVATRFQAGVRHLKYSVPARITLSIGVACYPEHALGTQELIGCADRALYQAKAHGRNQVIGYSQYLLETRACRKDSDIKKTSNYCEEKNRTNHLHQGND